MIDVEPLTYRELLAPFRILPSGTHVDNLLMPDEIPLHPSIYRSDFAYTQKFVDEVRESVPKSMKQDIPIIEEVLGSELYFDIIEKGICNSGFKQFGSNHRELLEFEDFRTDANEDSKSVWAEAGCSSISIKSPFTKRNHIIGFSGPRTLFHHPMPLEKLRQYALRENGEYQICAVWYRHNLASPYDLYLRNFAIMFNNIGLKWLKKDAAGIKRPESQS